MIYNADNFPELPRGWASLTVDNSVDSAGNSNKKLKSKDALGHGRFPVIDQGQSDVSGYSDDESLVVEASESSPVILFGDHTRLLKQISQPFVPGADGTKLFRAKSFWDTRFVYQMLRAIKLPDKGYARHFQYLRDSVLPLPPLPEQKRIADKLDAVLARVDACSDRLDRFPAILKRFRQSVLAAATTGKLTAEWRASTDIAVRDINSRLADERARLWRGRGKYKPSVAANEIDSNEFADLPTSWLRGTLDQIAWSVKDGPHFSPKYQDTGIPFISGGSIKPGRIDLSIAKYISHELHRELSLRCKPEYHDILYTKGGTTGLAAVNTLYDDFNVWVHVAVLKLASKDLVNPFFVQYALNSPDCYAQSQRYTHGVGNQDLGLTRMINIVLPVPPVEEQTEIVRRVEALFAFADRLDARYQAARAQVEKLTPATLAKAFRGELVPQDPNDESASVLLERIRAQRSDQSVNKLKRGCKIATKIEN
ncbi:MAG: restriction endonuclease subunit S [Candidatus Nitrotoga sp.]